MKNKDNNTTIGYSFWGMIATIVGTVIGIGIFFKSPQIIDSTQSSVLTIVAWLVGSLIVGFMLMTYIEIASSTAKTGEVGSLSTWAHKFINPEVAKVIGIFLTIIYFPGIIVLLAIISTTFILESVKIGEGINSLDYAFGVWGDFFFIFCIAIGIIMFTFSLSWFLRKGGEKFQIFGTILKFVPFFILIVVGFFMGITGFIDTTPIGDPGKNPGIDEGWTTANGFFLAMPAIMFSFDGFLTTASLQNEMKEEEKSKFPKVMIISLIIVSTIYIWVAIMSTWLGDYGESGSGMSVPVVLTKMFDGQTWITIIVLLIITISGMTTVNGFMMSSFHAFKALSESKMIPDPHEKLLVKNKRGFPVNSALMMGGAFIIWLVIFAGAEIVNVAILGSFDVSTGEGYRWTQISDQISNANIIVVNVIYGVIILYALQNRKTKKVEVDYLKNFKLFAIIGSTGILFFSSYNLINIVVEVFRGDITQITIFVILTLEALTIGILYYFNETSMKKHEETIGKTDKNVGTKNIETNPTIQKIIKNPFAKKTAVEKPTDKKNDSELPSKKAGTKKPIDKKNDSETLSKTGGTKKPIDKKNDPEPIPNKAVAKQK